MSAILEIKGLTRRFGGLVAVNSVSVEVARGQVHGLIGPNGAGKTTLLNLIGGQTSPSEGRIVYNGRPIGHLSVEKRASVGIRRTFQNIKLFRDMSVLDNVKVGLHLSGRAEIFRSIFRTSSQRFEERELEQKAMVALCVVGLENVAHLPASSLAYGHRRLLEIARALAAEPELILLDEPAAGLNPTEAASLADLIPRFAQRGIAVVLVEHHMDVVMRVCHRITVLNHGRLLAEGSPEEIQQHPDVIAAYLGGSSAVGGRPCFR
jgi:branched-chain amino acid transport system ATP-binding protein